MESKKSSSLEITMLWDSTMVLVTGFPVWTSVAAGMMIGWSCRHRWLPAVVFFLQRPLRLLSVPLIQVGSNSQGGSKRTWMVLTGIAVLPAVRAMWRWFQRRVTYSTANGHAGLTGPAEQARDESEEGKGVVPGMPACTSSCDECSTSAMHITNDDLRMYLDRLHGNNDGEEPPWERIIDSSNENVSYVMSRRDPRDGGPPEYLSSTVFENCPATALRDFYMDSAYRREWDPLTDSASQLSYCPATGCEWGRIVKKFPLFCSPREYLLVWRIWKGPDNSSYCIIKECEHPCAARVNKPQRVEFYRSFWKITQLADRNAAEVVALHREDIGVQRDMAKMAVRRGTWTFVRKMDPALRTYVRRRASSSPSAETTTQPPDAMSLAHMVPPHLLRDGGSGVLEESSSGGSSRQGFFSGAERGCLSTAPQSAQMHHSLACAGQPPRRVGLRRRLLATVLLAGSGVVLAHGAAPWGAKVAAMCLVQGTHRRFLGGSSRFAVGGSSS